jgi:hypothetical protein|tara:strand:+ start:14354 stop:14782 length:429 start_codon:yes stop_codon:yes gene_type:complete
MNKLEIMNTYELDPKKDFWIHKQTGKHIISFEAIEKMIDYHEIVFEQPEKNFSTKDNEVALLITGRMLDDKLGNKECWSFGEANSNNCYIDYLWSMAEKRGKARVVMKLLGFYGGNNGFYSDVEMEIQGQIEQNTKDVEFGF